MKRMTSSQVLQCRWRKLPCGLEKLENPTPKENTCSRNHARCADYAACKDSIPLYPKYFVVELHISKDLPLYWFALQSVPVATTGLRHSR